MFSAISRCCIQNMQKLRQKRKKKTWKNLALLQFTAKWPPRDKRNAIKFRVQQLPMHALTEKRNEKI